MQNVGQIPWNVTAICETFKTPYRKGKTRCERRFGEPFCGPSIPSGLMIEYHPISANDQMRHHQLGKKVLPGSFVGYALYAGGIWNGDTLVADEEIQNLDRSDIYVRRLNAKVLVPIHGDRFTCPCADENRTSIHTRSPSDQGEEHRDGLQGEAVGRDPADTEATMTFGAFLDIYFIVIMFNQE